jgi:hypothetical protein
MERGEMAERCNRLVEEMRRFGGRIATLRREGCNGTGLAVADISMEFKKLCRGCERCNGTEFPRADLS